MSTPSSSTGKPRHSSRFPALSVITGAAILGLAAWLGVNRPWEETKSGAVVANLVSHVVRREPFTLKVVDRGELTSSSNVEVLCEVKSRNTAGTAIIEIVPEGTYVQPGDIICKLDSSALMQEAMQQESLANTSLAVMIQSKNLLELAQITRDQYLGGDYKQLEETALAEILVAQENLRRAQQVVEFSTRMAERGYRSKIQLEADRFAHEKAKTDLKVAETKLDVLQNFTKKKSLTQYESDIRTAEAKTKADEATYNLEHQKYLDLKQQVEVCTIRAPQAGQVVYASSQGWRDEDEPVIKAGTLVRERQVIVRLPDPKRMQVEAQINEARVALLRSDMPAIVRVDAFPDARLRARVTRVNEFPEPERWNSTNKRYLTFIEVLDEYPGIRPGLTAQVEVIVSEQPAVLQVPVQAVVQHAGQHYCVVREGEAVRAKAVLLGDSNEKHVIVEEGLEEGEVVAINSRQFWELAAKTSSIDLSNGNEAGPDSKPEAATTLASARKKSVNLTSATDRSAKDAASKAGQTDATPSTENSLAMGSTVGNSAENGVSKDPAAGVNAAATSSAAQ